MQKPELGDRVKDRISGLTGIVTGITDWLFGCRRISVQPEANKDGAPADPLCVDEGQLEIVAKGACMPPTAEVAKPPTPTGGPREDVARGQDVSRF